MWSRRFYKKRPRPSRGCWTTERKNTLMDVIIMAIIVICISLLTPFFFSHLVYSYDTVLNNLKLHRRHLQRMDKVMETGVKDTYFFIKTALGLHLPAIQLIWIDSRKFLTVSSGILYQCSWRTLFSWLRDDGGNLLLTLHSKTDHNCSIYLRLAIMLVREDAEVHLHCG